MPENNMHIGMNYCLLFGGSEGGRAEVMSGGPVAFAGTPVFIVVDGRTLR